jgi:hypothetical protein
MAELQWLIPYILLLADGFVRRDGVDPCSSARSAGMAEEMG